MNGQRIALAIIAAVLVIGITTVFLLTRKPAPEPAPVAVATETQDVGMVRDIGPSMSLAPSSSAPAPAPRVVEAAPELVVEEVAVAEPVEPEGPLPGAMVLTVVEHGTGIVLPGVRVRLTAGNDESRSVEAQTDAVGRVNIPELAAGTYNVQLQWGRLEPQEPGALQLAEGQTLRRTLEMNARTVHRFQLQTAEEEPVPNFPVLVRAAPTGGFQGGGFQMAGGAGFQTLAEGIEEAVVTDHEGYFEVRAYPGMAPVFLRSEERALFAADRRRARWANPMIDMRPLREEDTRIVYLRPDAVRATGILINPPETEPDQPYIASVIGRGVNNLMIPVENNRFTFFTIPGGDVNVTISRRSGELQGFRGVSREKTMQVELPEDVYEFEFEVPFDERYLVRGTVFGPDGKPVSGVRVRANGFGEAGSATATGGGGGWAAGGFARGGGGTPGLLRGQSSYVAHATDTGGRFEFELPPMAEYLFSADSDSLPVDMRGADPVTYAWEPLHKGEEVTIHLQISSLVWGRVLDTDNRPVPGIQVMLAGREVDFSGRTYAATTDEAGIFEMNVPPIDGAENLPPGSTRLYVTAQSRELMGLAPARLDDPSPVSVIAYPYVTGEMHVTWNDGTPATQVQVSSFYIVDGFAEPLPRRQANRVRNDEGVYNIARTPAGITYFGVQPPRSSSDQVIVVRVPENVENPVINVMLDSPPPPPEPEAETAGAEGGRGERGPGGWEPGGGRGPGGWEPGGGRGPGAGWEPGNRSW